MEKRNEQREKARETIVFNTIPWIMALISFLLFIVFYNPLFFYDIEYLFIIVFVLGVIFGIRGIPRIIAAQNMIREIDASIKINKSDR